MPRARIHFCTLDTAQVIDYARRLRAPPGRIGSSAPFHIYLRS